MSAQAKGDLTVGPIGKKLLLFAVPLLLGSLVQQLYYIEENLLSFVTGSKSLDEYDEFVETVKSMNIQRVIELKQAAYDRFNK